MAAIRQMSDKDIETISKVITKWPSWKPFGWEEIRQELKTVFKFSEVSEVWTRQGLNKHERITSAFKVKKEAIRKSKGKAAGSGEDIPPSEQKLRERIAALEAENLVLKAENDRLHEKFERWLYNAWTQNVNETVLDRPLPTPNGEQKKKVGSTRR